jgi:rRNA maturation protein Nop10
MSETILIVNMDSHFHGNDRHKQNRQRLKRNNVRNLLILKTDSCFHGNDRHKQNRQRLKRNNVRNYINSNHGFSFSWE